MRFRRSVTCNALATSNGHIAGMSTSVPALAFVLIIGQADRFGCGNRAVIFFDRYRISDNLIL
jgi:hypothetical protein